MEARLAGGREDWNDEAFVRSWLASEPSRATERRRQFMMIRSLVPKLPQEDFRYVNVGAGTGVLDEILLDRFPLARATLVDGSSAMLEAAANLLSRFGERVELARADLSSKAWTDAVSGSFDLAVSTFTIHNLEDAARVRALYGELYRLVGPGGMFINLDFVQRVHPAFIDLARWAAQDPESELSAQGGGSPRPGTLVENLNWMKEAGFEAVDVVWKNTNLALMCGLRTGFVLPAAG